MKKDANRGISAPLDQLEASGRVWADLANSISSLEEFLQSDVVDSDRDTFLLTAKELLQGGRGAFRNAFVFAVSGAIARSSGLEGFLFSKLEHDSFDVKSAAFVGDYFRHVEQILSSVSWLSDVRALMRNASQSWCRPQEKSDLLNCALVALVQVLRSFVGFRDPSLWVRSACVYLIVARAYNRTRAGKTFFDSLDEQEFERIRESTSANTIWLMDVFQIGARNRWGTGGGSPFSIKAYHAKPELGGDEGLRQFVSRAHRMGYRVIVDFTPNHTSLDSPCALQQPDFFVSLDPPREISDAEVLSGLPVDKMGRPVYCLQTVFFDGVPRRMLFHHPRPDTGSDTWVDMAQIDISKGEARAWVANECAGIFRRFGVDGVRMDMAYELIQERFSNRWPSLLKRELSQPRLSEWVVASTKSMVRKFRDRMIKLSNQEILAEIRYAVRGVRKDAIFIDEAYCETSSLSVLGANAVYNKNDHDPAAGHFGLYDALVSLNGNRIRAAIRHIGFRRWQIGGATMLNYVGTHEEFEGNPVDIFGCYFMAAASCSLVFRPCLLLNGIELCVGQQDGVIFDRGLCEDASKAIPFDVPVLLNWAAANADLAKQLSTILSLPDKHSCLFRSGVVNVLDTKGSGDAVAWSIGSNDCKESIVVLASFSCSLQSFEFSFVKDGLTSIGAFFPVSTCIYDFIDVCTGKTLQYRGAELLADGLVFSLSPGEVFIFEVKATASFGCPGFIAKAPAILHVSSECVPFIKTGGLADVVGRTAKAVAAAGAQVVVVLPKFADIELSFQLRRMEGAFPVCLSNRVLTVGVYESFAEGVRFIFVENDYFFGRAGAYYGVSVDFSDNADRFAFFSLAAVEVARFIDFKPNIVHVHDWQCALVPRIIDHRRSRDIFYQDVKTVLTIHNGFFQGRFLKSHVKALLGELASGGDDPRRGFSFLRSGIACADSVTTVSETYANELLEGDLGKGLHDLLSRRELVAIRNDIDPVLYDPCSDAAIYRQYSVLNVSSGKAQNKLFLQRQLGLRVGVEFPLLSIVCRMVQQKGVDLVAKIVPRLVKRGCQFVFSGDGDEAIMGYLKKLEVLFPDSVSLHSFDERFARQVYASSDVLLMPSRFEPCGISQQIAHRYGTLVVASPTGGLLDTVEEARFNVNGDGFFMQRVDAASLLVSVEDALSVLEDLPGWRSRQMAAMQKWQRQSASPRLYLEHYRSLSGLRAIA